MFAFLSRIATLRVRWAELARRAGASATRLSLAVVFAAWAAFGFAPPASAAATTFAANSLIIPMDATSQNFGMWKAYGLVYNLLQNGVPVSWAIANPKVPDTFTGTDFTSGAATIQVLAGGATVSPYTYTGGPFIIDSANAAAAQSIITAWWATHANQPVVHRVAAGSVTANVDLVLRTPPRIALESINANISIAYFNAAGIPDSNGAVWSASSPNVINVGLIGCNNRSATTCPSVVGDGALFQQGVCSRRAFDVFVTSHNSGYSFSTTDPTNVGTQAYAELDNFVGQGGGWIALCHSILSNENIIAGFYALPASGTTAAVRSLFKSPHGGGFLTTGGFPVISNKGDTWIVDAPDLPMAQSAATTVANGLPGGSVQTWPSPLNSPPIADAPTYWPDTEQVSHFDASGAKYDFALNGVYHDGDGQGKLTFIGGHSYSTSLPYSTNNEGPYLRFFYNALFFNGAAVANMTLVPSVATVPQSTPTPVQLVFRNTGASFAANVGQNGGVTITLAAGVSFVSMAAGPAPVVASGPGGTTILTWGALGDIAAGATALSVNTVATMPVVGSAQIATINAKYGDVYNESFSENGCSGILVLPTPGPTIAKTPAVVGPVNVGDIVTWTLSFSNQGSANLVNPFVEDVLPSSFGFVSATPAPTSVVPVAGGTRLRWTLASPLAPGSSGIITFRAAVQTATGQPFTNTATLNGTDATGAKFSGSSSSQVSVTPPQAQVDKSVAPTGSVLTGTTLTYTLRPSSAGPTLLTDVRFFDPPPLNTTYVANSANQGGTLGAYTPLAAAQGVDTGPDPQTTMDLTYSAVSPFTQALGSTITVTMALVNKAASSGPIINVTAVLTPSDGASTCVPLSSQPVASVPATNATVTITFTCTIATFGEISWEGDASGTFAGADYGFPTANSATVLGVPTTTGTNVVKWIGMATDTNTPPAPSRSFAPGTAPGLFAFDGATAIWERYDVQLNTWVKSPAPGGLTNNLPGNAAAGAAMVYDGKGFANGFVYAFQGGTNAFWRYKLSDGTTGAWANVANAPWTVGAGGALTVLGQFIYGLQGNTQTAFARYDTTTNTWTPLAPLPETAKNGATLATDGTNIFALRGGDNHFYRYNVATDTWSARLANPPFGSGQGSGMVGVGTNLYFARANGAKDFARFVPNATNGTWTRLAGLPANAKAGSGLATDGTTIWATQGDNKKGLFAYDVADGTWSTLASSLDNITTGGALTWVPGSAPALNTTSLSAPVLVTGSLANPATIQVQMTLTSSTAVTGVNPTALAIASSNATPPATLSASCTVSPSIPQNIAAGGSLTFTWTCTNAFATGTTLANTLGSLIFTAGATGATPATTWNTATSNSVLVTQPLTYRVTVNNGTSFTQVSNQALLSDSGAFAAGIGSNLVTTPVQQPAAVTVAKSVSPTGQVTPGTALTYTIDVQETTANPTANVVVTDVVPAGTTFVSCATTIGTCSQSAGTVTYNLGNIGNPNGFGAATLTMTVTVNTPATAGISTINNTAAFTLNAGASTPTNTVSNTVLTRPAVTISKSQAAATDANGQVAPGATITYTLTVANPAGAVTATHVTVSDVVPADTSFVSCSGGTGCSQSGGTVTWTIGTVPAGASVPVTLVVTVNNPAQDGDTISNSATVSADDGQGGTVTSVSNIVALSVAATPIISAVKSATPPSGSTVKPGDTITYTIAITNSGNANTVTAFLHEVVPAGTTYVVGATRLNGNPVVELSPGAAAGTLKVFSCGGADPGGDGGTLFTLSAPLQPGCSTNVATVTFQVTVNDGFSGTITNVGTAGTGSTPPVNTNQTTHLSGADLTIAKTVNIATPSVGSTVTFTVTVQDTGPGDAAGVSVADALPSGYAFVSAAPSVGSYNPATGVWTIGSLANGANATLAINAIVLAAGNYTNTATATSTTFDPTTPNTASASTAPAGVADVTTTVSPPPTARAASTVTVPITFSNNGPSTAAGIAYTVTLPPGLSGVTCSGSVSCSYDSGTGAVTVSGLPGSLPSGASTSFTLAYAAPPSGTVTVSTAISTATSQGANVATDNASGATTITPVAELAVSKSSSPQPYVPGAVLTYTITVSNSGPSGVIAASVVDTLPAPLAGFTWTCTATPPAACGAPSGSGSISTTVDLPAGSHVTFSVTGTVPAATTGALTNTATVTVPAGTIDPVPGNNSATDNNPVGPQADLRAVKSSSPSPYVPGAPLTYTVVVSNAGPSDVANARVQDALPAPLAGFTWTCTPTAPASCGTPSGTGDIDALVTLPAGSHVTFSITGTVPAGTSGAITNTATVTAPAGTTDPVPGDNQSNNTNPVGPQADLAVTKSSAPDPYVPGAGFTYTIVVSNAGPSDVTNARVQDVLPAPLAGFTWTCAPTAPAACGTPSGSGDIDALVTLPVGSSVTFTVSGTLPSSVTGQLTNTVTVRQPLGTKDPVLGNNFATDDNPSGPQADLAITKLGTPKPYVPGLPFSYSLVVSNAGPSDVVGARVQDVLPAPLEGFSWTCTPAASCGTASGTGDIDVLVTLPAATQATFSITGIVPPETVGTLSNTATVTAPLGVSDTVPGNNSATDVAPGAPQADLTLGKTVSNPAPNVGSSVTFTLTVHNNGPSAASDVVVNDLLPNGYGFISATPSQGTYTAATGVWAVGTLDNAGSATLTITATVLASGTYINTATASSGTTDPDTTNNTGTAATTPIAIADLAMSKTVSNAAPNVGSSVTFTLTVLNNGPSTPSDVVVNDLLPSGYAFVSATPSQGTYTAATGVWAIGALASGGNATLAITATVLASGNYTNTATASSSITDPDTTNNTGTAITTPTAIADLVMSKTVGNAAPNVGSNVTFTLTVLNNGPSAAGNVVVNDLLPDGYGFISAVPSQGTYTAATGVWAVGTLANAGSATLAVTAAVLASGNYTNTATAGSSTTDPDAANNTGTATTTPIAIADLVMSKTVSNPTPNVGSSVTFTLAVHNNGPSAASDVVVNDVLPSGYALLLAAASQRSYDPVTGVWTIGSLASGASATLTITAVVLPSGDYLNTAIASSSTPDPDASNNTGTAGTTPTAIADLVMSKTVSDTAPNVGSIVTFTLTVLNNGPSAAADVVVNDLLPSGYGFVSATPSQGTYAAATGVWAVGTLANAGSATLAITATVLAGGNYTNTATAGSSIPDPDTTNNTGTTTPTPRVVADLAVSKSSSPQPYVPGAVLTYTITVSNSGPSGVTGAQVADRLPAPLAGFEWTCTPAPPAACGTPSGTGDISTTVNLPAGSHVTFSVTGTVPAGTTGALVNTATVTAPVGTIDPVPGNNGATDTNPVGPQADLSVTKSSAPDPYVPGAGLTYTVVVSNAGPSDVANARVQDALPPALAGFGWTCTPTAPAACGTPSGTGDIDALVTLPAGSHVTFSISGTVPAGTSGALVNTATATPPAGTTDPVPGNNGATDTNPVGPQADLLVSKSSSPQPYVPGAPLIYTVVVSNAGPSDVANARVQDALPAPLAGFTWTCTPTAPAACGTPSGTGNIDALVTLPAGSHVTFSITGTVPAGTSGALANTATVTPPAGTTDPVPGDNQATDTNPVGPQANLAVAKSSAPNPYVPGAAFSYTILVSNAGPSDVTNARVQDALPAPLAGFTWTCTPAPPAACGTLGGTGNIDALVTLPVASSVTFSVTGTVPSGTSGALVNTATATTPAGTTDPVPGNNQATDTNPVGPQADLAITKLGTPKPYVPGLPFSYSLVVSNAGPSDVANARVQDALPAALAGFNWTCTPAASCGTVSGTGDIDVLVTLPAATQVTFSITGIVPPETIGAISNTGTVTPPLGVSDPVPGNNSATDVAPAAPQADVVMSKTVSNPTPSVGSSVTFTLTVHNNGPSVASNVLVNDLLPSGYGFVSATPSQGTYIAATGVWAVGTLANAGSATLTITAIVLASGNYTNTATAGSSTTDPDASNNTGTTTTTPTAIADLVMSKTVSNTAPNVGSSVTFTLTVLNNGPSTPSDVVVNDLLPSGYAFVSATPSQGSYDAATGVWTVGALASGGNATLAITATVLASGNYTNSATAGSSIPDPNVANNTGTTTTTPAAVADLAVSKSSSPQPYVPGAPLTYTVVVSNAGPSDAVGARVQDALPAPLLGFSWTCTPTAPAACSAASGTGDISTTVDLPAGSHVTFSLTGTVPAGTSGALVNTATVTAPTGTLDPVPGNNGATDTNPVGPQADLLVAKSSSPQPYVPGASLTYTVVVSNAGPSDVANARVQDALPAPLASFTWTCTPTPPAACGTASGTGNIDALVTLPAGSHVTFSVTGTVPAATTGALINTATVTAPVGTLDPVPGNNSAADNNPVGPQADLLVAKSSSPQPYVPGAPLTYTVVVSNAGPSDVTNARVQDALPAPLAGFAWTCTPTAPAACGTASGTGNIDALVTLPAGSHVTFSITGTVPAGTSGAITNTATVTPPVGTIDPVPGDNQATDTNPVGPQADLAVTKTSSPQPYVPGAAFSYTIVVTNAGPSDVTNARVQDALPAPLAGFTWTCTSTAPAACGTASGTGSIDALVTLPVGSSVTFTVSGTLSASVTGQLTNTVTVTAPLGVKDPVPGNNAATDDNPAGPQADLAITKLGTPKPYVPGLPFSYSLVVSNAGPSDVANARVQDALPAPLAGFTWTCTPAASCGTATGTGDIDVLVTLLAATQATFSITGTVPPETTGALSNTGTVTAPLGVSDPVPGNNSATDVAPGAAQADLAIAKTVSNPTPNVGSSVTFTLTVHNNGPSAASGVLVNDLLPNGYGFISAVPSVGTYDAVTGVWTLGSLAGGASATLAITATVLASGNYVNTAIASSGTPDPDATNNTATAATTPTAIADLVMSKTVNTPAANVGSNVVFTLTVQNHGPSAASNVVVNDLLPSGYGFVSATPSQGTYDAATGLWTVGTLANAGSGTLAITATVLASGNYVNTAVASSSTLDPDATNNTGTAVTTPGAIADLALTKTVSNATPNVGTSVTFTLTVHNNGPSTASNVVVNDLLPSGYAFVSATPSQGSYDAATGVWTVGVLAGGGNATLAITATVLASGNYINTATAGSSTPDPDAANNTGTTTITPGAVADLAVSKSSSPQPYVPGAPLTYTVVVSNAGPSDATNARVQDALPAALASFGWTCTATPPSACGTPAGTGNIDTLVTLPAGTHVTFSVTGTVPPGTIGALVNTATVTTPVGIIDPVPGNNSATDTNPVGPQGDLRVAKSSSPQPYVPGSPLTYTVVVSNAGPSDVVNARVQDALPAALASFTWTCTPTAPAACGTPSGTGNIDALVTLPAGSHVTFSVTGTVPAGTTGALVNTATATPPAGTTDPVPGDNQATDTNPVGPQADLLVAKSSSPQPYVPGAPLTYTVVVSNAGPSNVTNARVQDALPAPLAGFTWTCISIAPAVCGTPSGSGNIDALVTLPAGSHVTFSVTGTVPAGTTGALDNSATVAAPVGILDPVPGNNVATDTNPVGPQADLLVTKSSSPQPYVPGAPLTYTVVVSNAGPSDVSNARVQDVLPAPLAGFTWTCTPAPPAACGTQSGTGNIDALVTLPAGSHVTFSVTGTVPAGTSGALVNTATATAPAGTTDPVPGDNQATDTNPVGPQADLLVTKSSSPQPYVPGVPLTYTVVVSNAGPSDVANARVQDALPAPLAGFTWTCTPAPPAACGTPSGTGDIDALVTLPAGSHVTFSVTGTVPAGTSGALVNTATVTPPVGTADPAPGDNQATDTNPVGPQADLLVTKSSSPQPYVPGAPLTYTVVVSNAGPSDVANARVQDALPPPLEGFTWTCTPVPPAACGTASGTGNIDDLVTLPAGSHVTFSVTGTVPAGTTGALVNTATAIAPVGTIDPLPGNNVATDTNPVGPQADLRVTKSSSPQPYVPGAPLTYTVVVSNAGPSDVANARVQDALPAPLAGFAWTCTPAPPAACATPSGTGDIDVLVTLPAATQVTFSITGTVPPQAVGPITNTGTVSPPLGVSDPVPGNNSATDVAPAAPQADLTLGKTVSNAAPSVGSNVTFTLTVQNRGPSAASNVVVDDLLPTGYGFVSATPSQGSYDAATGVWTVGTLANAGSATLGITATVLASGNYINTATAGSSIPDPDATNNTGTVTTTPGAIADLALTKTVSNAAPNVGSSVTFTLTVHNNGPSAAADVVVNDLLPSGYGFVSATPSQGTYTAATGVWAVGTLANAGSATLAITATVLASGDYTNTATAGSGIPDPNPANNTGTTTTAPGAVADLTVSKSSSPQPYVPGAPLTYTVVVSNAGPSDVTGARVQDALPAPLAGFSWTCTPAPTPPAACSAASGTGDINTTVDLPAGSHVTFSVTGTVPPGTSGALVNTASVTAPAGTLDPVPGNNSGTDTNPVGPQADLLVAKSSSPQPYVPGAPLTYTVVVSNAGPSDVANARVQDALPAPLAGFTWTCTPTAPASCGSSSGTGNIDALVTLPAGSHVTFSITGTVPAGTSGALVNTATATPPAGTTDPVPGDNQATDTNPVGPQADLLIIKASAPNPYVPGATFSYGILVGNAGPSDVTNARVQDALPAALADFTWTCTPTPPAACGTGSGTGNIDALVTLPADSHVAFSVTGAVPAGTSGALVNTATVTPPVGTTDPVPGSNVDTDTNPVGPRADLRIAKSSSPQPYVPGALLTYTIVVSNAGPSDVVGARVQDALPAPLAGFTWTCTPAASCGTASGTGDIDALVTLPVGTSATFTVSGTPAAGLTGVLTNTATVSAPAGTTDPAPADNIATDDNPAGGLADLELTKTVSNTAPNVGSNVIFTLAVRNHGPSAATNVVVHELLPSGYSFVAAVPSVGTYDVVAGIWAIGSLANGANATLAITATVLASGNYINVATVSSANTDPDRTNNTGATTITGAAVADLAVSKSSSPQPYVPGAPLTYTVVVSNAGPSDVTRARVQDALPAALAGFTWTCTPTPPASCAIASGTGNVDALVTLPLGSHVTFSITGTVPAGTSGRLVNTAKVTPPVGTTDPVPDNNVATDDNPVLPPADLAIGKTVSNATPSVDSSVTFTVTVQNHGPNEASDAVVIDQLPSGYSFVAAVPSVGLYDPVTGVWAIGSLANGSTVTLTIIATVLEGGIYAAGARVSASTPDPVLANNVAHVVLVTPYAIPAMQGWGLAALVLLLLMWGMSQLRRSSATSRRRH